jgi:hypothetical protein
MAPTIFSRRQSMIIKINLVIDIIMFLYNIMDKIYKNISHLGDILAIPFFLLLVIYFYRIPNRSNIENVLFIFSLVGFIADIWFTYIRYFLRKSP